MSDGKSKGLAEPGCDPSKISIVLQPIGLAASFLSGVASLTGEYWCTPD
jgi:hypothetical protein